MVQQAAWEPLTQVGEKDGRSPEPVRDRLRQIAASHDEQTANPNQTRQSVRYSYPRQHNLQVRRADLHIRGE